MLKNKYLNHLVIWLILLNLSTVMRFYKQENDQVQEELLDTVTEDEAIVIDNNYNISNNSNIIIYDDEIRERIRSVNRKQMSIFCLIHDWTKICTNNLQANIPVWSTSYLH